MRHRGTALAHAPRFGPAAVRASADGRIQALTVPIRGGATSYADVAAVRNLRSQMIPAAFAGAGGMVLAGGTV